MCEGNDVVRCFRIGQKSVAVLSVRDVDKPPLAASQSGRHLLEPDRHLDGIVETHFIDVNGFVDRAHDRCRIRIAGDRTVEGWRNDKSRLRDRSEPQSNNEETGKKWKAQGPRPSAILKRASLICCSHFLAPRPVQRGRGPCYERSSAEFVPGGQP